MVQTKISISNEQKKFVKKFRSLGFKSKSSLFRKALDLFIEEYKKKQLERSAQLYAEIYSTDRDLQELTESTTNDWPE